MRVPWSWLQEFVTLSLKPAAVAERLTLAGCEVEAIEAHHNEVVLTLGVTPNRPDCLSIRGVAREAAAHGVGRLREPTIAPIAGQRSIREWVGITVADRRGCPRYAARVIDGVRIGPSPASVRARLEAVGLRSVNNVVDATNYVMWELGQPLHAFDARFIRGKKIVIGRAAAPLAFVTLDGGTRALVPDDLLIQDGVGPIAIAGVMGGANSEVRDDTTTLILESAYFHPDAIRRTSRRLGLATESARRFERGVDPSRVVAALHRLTALIVEWAGGTPSKDWIDRYPVPIAPCRIRITPDEVTALLGVATPPKEMAAILTRLGCRVTSGRTWTVTVPTDRPDLTRPIDLIEEVARCRGYDRIPTTLPRMSMTPIRRPPHEACQTACRAALVAWGFHETYHYAFLPAVQLARFDPNGHAVSIGNPLGQEPTVLATTLAPGLLDAVQTNRRMGSGGGRLFQIRRAFQRDDAGGVRERLSCAGVLFGARKSMSWTERADMVDFYDVKGRVEGLLQMFGLDIENSGADRLPTFLHPGEASGCRVNGVECGCYGMMHPQLVQSLAIEVPVGYFDLDLEAVAQQVADRELRYRPLPRFPGVRRDISVVVPADRPSRDIVAVMRQAGNTLLRDVTLFDVYRGEQVGAAKKSLTYALYYQNPERTLTDDEVNQVQQQVIRRLQADIGAEIR